MASTSIQTNDASFDDATTIHPWDNLIYGLVQNMDDNDLDTCLQLSQERIKSDYNRVCCLTGDDRKYGYFKAVVKNGEKDDAVDFLENLMSVTGLHGEQGALNYEQQFRIYREERLLFQQKSKSTDDPTCSFGRWEVQTQVIQDVTKDACKGVAICGMPGMGKTSVALQICSRLTDQNENWRIIHVNQRGRTEFEDLFGDLVRKIMAELRLEEVPSVGMSLCDIKRHLQSLLTALADQNYNYLILLDDLDAYCSSPEQLSTLQQILRHDILYSIANCNNIKFLLTTSTKLSSSNAALTSGGCKVLFGGQMIEYKLKPLTSTEIQTIFEESTKMTFKEEFCQNICEILDGNAMAVSAVAVLLRTSTTSLEKFIDDLQRSSTIMQSHVFYLLQKSFDNQSDRRKCLLSRLTVFETGHFDVSAAVAVNSEIPACKMKIDLDKLAGDHLIENEKVFIKSKLTVNTNTWYLHSLVFGFLNKSKHFENLREMQREARLHFVQYLCAKFVAKKKDMPVGNLKTTLDECIVDIKKFFSIMCDDDIPLLENMPHKGHHTKYKSKIVQLKNILTIAEHCLTPSHRCRFVKQQAEWAKNVKDLYMYIYWRCLEAKCLLDVDRTTKAEIAIDELFNDFRIGNDLPFRLEANYWTTKASEADEIPAVGQLFLMKGMIYFYIGRKERNKSKLEMAMTFLEKALQMYTQGMEKAKKVNAFPNNFFKEDLASVHNLKGCVYFKLGDLMKARECHEGAIYVETKKSPGPYLTDYRVNVAATYHQIGLETRNEEEKQKYLKQALEAYNRCIEINKNTQNVISPTHARILQNRAEIYHVHGEYEMAIKDGRQALKIAQATHERPPHTDLTSAMQRVAHYCFKLGRKTKTEDQKKGRRLLQEAMDMYNGVLEHIRMGGMPFQHTDDQQLYRDLLQQIQLGQIHLKPGSERPTYERILNDIQRGTMPAVTEGENVAYNHVARLLKERKFQQSGNRTYRDTKESHRKVMKLLSYSSNEIRAKMREYEEYERGQYIPDPMQDIDHIETESSSSNSRSSSGSDSGGRDSPMMDIHLELVEARKRRDSGMSEGDINPELGDVDMEEQDVNMQKMDGAFDGCHAYEIQRTEEDTAHQMMNVSSSNDLKRVARKRLIRQVSFDGDEFDGSHKELTEQSGVSIEENNSVEMRSSQEPNTATSSQYTNRDSGVSVTSFGSTGSGRKLSSVDSRKSWRSSAVSFGSQESWSESFDISNATCDDAFSSGTQTTKGWRGKEGWKRKSSSSINVQSRQQLWSSAGSQDSVTAKIDGLVMEDETEISLVLENLEEPAKKVQKTGLDTQVEECL